MQKAPIRFHIDLKLDRSSIARIIGAVGIGVLGVVMAHHSMILSGFSRIQTGLGDTRLIHYLLEHGYRWAARAPAHRDFWSPPFFYPMRNVTAYSDLLLSLGPVYWLWRAAGAAPDLAFGLWILSMSTLNYLAGLLFFRRGLGFGMPAAVAGAALVSFGAPRLNQLGHLQLLPCFYPLLALYALARLFGDLALGRRARAGYWLLAMAGLVAQLYAAVYAAWFLIAGLVLAAMVALAMPSCRGRLLAVARRDVWAIVAAGAVGVLLLQPFLSHYLPAAREVRSQSLLMVAGLQPRVWSWLDVGERNWIWGWVVRRGWVPQSPFLAGEHRLGIGFVTTIASGVGCCLGFRRAIGRLAAVVALITWVATTYVPGNHLALVGAGVSYYCIAGLFHEAGAPAWRATGLAVVAALLLLMRFPNPYVIVLAVTTIVFCVIEIARASGRPLGLIVPGLALAVISVKLFNFSVLAYCLVPVAPIAGFLAYYWRPRHQDVALASLALLMLFATVIAFFDRPGLLTGAAAVALISLAASAPRQYRPPAWVLVRVMLIAIVVVVTFYNHDSLWLTYSGWIPGAIAIRAVGRVVLILLLPAALMLAFLVEFLDQRQLAIASWAVVLFCLAEQGMTSETFDAAANRASVEALARRVIPGRVAFYYRPMDDRPYYLRNLDAMWASLASGVPTVNGYSGYFPRSWDRFFRAEFDRKADVEGMLAEWERERGLLPRHIQWIGPDRSNQDRAPSLGARASGTISGDNDTRPPQTGAGMFDIQGKTR